MWLLIAVLLSACGTAGGDDDRCLLNGSSTSMQVADSGLTLEPSIDMHVTFEQMEQFYLETEVCVGVLAAGPTVVFEDFKGPMGVISIGTGRIRINTSTVWYRSCDTDEDVLRHEFVHHLLHARGESLEDNKAHKSPLFKECG